MSKHKIAIATAGRFHVLDLARELSALGHDVLFYSYVPPSRASRFGLPRENQRSVLHSVAPLLAAHRFAPKRFKERLGQSIHVQLDRAVARRLEPCDVFICMSGMYVEALRVAQEKYGAFVFLERCSRHILSQKAILEQLTGVVQPAISDFSVKRELAGYEAADRVTIPSQHVRQSFEEKRFPIDKLFQNPYGVDVTTFSPTPAPADDPRTVIFAGLWCYRKGCELLAEAVARFHGQVRLIHVGPVGDAPLPDANWFEHVDAVPQMELPQYYGKAHVFALASREEGLAFVQPQALRSGLHIVCTDRTGGEDVRQLTGLGDEIRVVPHDNVDALCDALQRALDDAIKRFRPGDKRDLIGSNFEDLSWRAYALRYERKITEVMQGR